MAGYWLRWVRYVSEKLTIDLWTDLVCPFCYIGEARLRKALEAEGIAADIRIRSFELSRSAASSG